MITINKVLFETLAWNAINKTLQHTFLVNSCFFSAVSVSLSGSRGMLRDRNSVLLLLRNTASVNGRCFAEPVLSISKGEDRSSTLKNNTEPINSAVDSIKLSFSNLIYLYLFLFSELPCRNALKAGQDRQKICKPLDLKKPQLFVASCAVNVLNSTLQ